MENTLLQFFEAYIGQVVWYALWTLPAFFILWFLFKSFFSNRRIQATQKADSKQFLREIKNSLITIIVFASIDLFVFHDSMKTLETATFKVYHGMFSFSTICYGCFITLMLFVVEDTYFYWMHKTVHSPKLYKLIHRVHHESIDTTPFTSYSFHPIEAALEIVPMGLIMVMAYFFPVPFWGLLFWQLLSIALNVLGHSGYELFPSYWNNYWFLKWKLPATHHNMHHERFNGNYGLYFIWWDRIMGTEFPDYEEKFKSVFKAKNTDEMVYHDLKVASIVNETNTAYSIYFEQFPYAFRNYKAGQHVNIKISINAKFHYRTFSLSSSPTKDAFLRLSIKKVEDGLVTNYLINNIKANGNLSISIPKGHFYIEQNPAHTRTILLFAGGSGITPLFSMIRTVLNDEPNSKIVLFYTNRNLGDSLFLEDLVTIEKSHSKHFKLIPHFSEKDNRITENNLSEIVAAHPADSYFICGPDGFMDLVHTVLDNCSVDRSKVKAEKFTNKPNALAITENKIVSKVKAIINNTAFSFNVLENETLLDAAIRENINIPFSCRSGMCGTCIANCSQGEVVMDENQTFLSNEAIKHSKILLCQSKAVSENIHIAVNT
jgi:ring-1,2-phenylacetyl-CoA epoxidase subunit PaaE